MNHSEKDDILMANIAYFHKYVHELTKPMRDFNHLGFKEYFINVHGEITIVYHDWYVEMAANINSMIDHKKKELGLI